MSKWHLQVMVNTASPTAKLKGLPQGYGYGDFGYLTEPSGNEVWHGPMRAWPNPFMPGVGTPWQDAYGCVAPGTYRFAYYVSKKNGPSLMLNGGEKVPTRYPNPNQNGAGWAKAVTVHSGGLGKNPKWPGSAACLTIDPDYATAFFSFFKDGDTGEVEVVDAVSVPHPLDVVSPVKDKSMVSQAFSKPVITSKTIWVNSAALAAAVVAKFSGVAIDSTTVALILAAANIGLRFITKRPLLPDAAFERWVVDLMLDSYDIDIDGILKARKRGRRATQTLAVGQK